MFSNNPNGNGTKAHVNRWALFGDKSDATQTRYYWTLNTAGLPPDPAPEPYYWTPFTKGLDQSEIPGGGAFFSKTRWDGLMRLNGQKHGLSREVDPTVLDARDCFGRPVSVSLGNKIPSVATARAWFKDGQKFNPYAVKCLENAKDNMDVNWDWQCGTDDVGHMYFTFDTQTPYAPLQDKYVKLRKKDYLLLGSSSGRDSPSEAYIPLPAIDGMKRGLANPRELKRFGIRTETGQARWLQVGTNVDVTPGEWEKRYDRATKTMEQEGGWNRRIDPEIMLWIVPNGNKWKAETLRQIFQKVKQEKRCKQEFQVVDKPPQGTYHLGTSPFLDYYTFIFGKDHANYLAVRPDRAMPEDLDTAKAIANVIAQHQEPAVSNDVRKRLDPQKVDYTLIVNAVSAAKINAAKKTRQYALKQGDVMGASATEIAKTLGWGNEAQQVGPAGTCGPAKDGGSTSVWPGTGNYPAEWLHRSAYSWGGLAEAGDYPTSQLRENLVFGTSECNGVMTRYEKAWQSLFIKEANFRRTHNGTNPGEMKGTLISQTRGIDLRRRPVPPSLQDEHLLWSNGGTWTKLAETAEAPWLCYAMSYTLTLDTESHILGAHATDFETTFYPFQRGFFTVLEQEVDQYLLEILYAKAEKSYPRNDVKDEEEADDMDDVDYEELLGEAGPGDTTIYVDAGDDEIWEEGYGDPDMGNGGVEEEPRELEEEKVGGNTMFQNLLQDGYFPQYNQMSSMESVPPIELNRPVAMKTEEVAEQQKGQPRTYQKLWNQVVTGQGNLEVDGIVFNRPRLLGGNDLMGMVEIEPQMLGATETGEAVLMSGVVREQMVVSKRQAEMPLVSILSTPFVAIPGGEDMRAVQSENTETTQVFELAEVNWLEMQGSSAIADGVSHFSDAGDEAAEQEVSMKVVPTTDTIPTVPTEYVIVTDILLFGFYPAQIYSVQGPRSTAINERVELKRTLDLGTLLPVLKDSDLNAIHLNNTVLTYRSVVQDTQRPGLICRTTVTLSGVLEPVNTVLRDVFGQEKQCIDVSCLLSMGRDWDKMIVPSGFTLRGELPAVNIDLFDIVKITHLGVDLMGSRVSPKGEYQFGYGFFGNAKVAVGGSALGMDVSWYLRKFKENYSMTLVMSDNEWTDVLGVPGLDIENVQFDAHFNSKAGMNSVGLGIRATMKLRSSTIVLRGYYSKSKWEIEGILTKVDFTMIEHLYEDIFGQKLAKVGDEHDFIFDTLRLCIGSEGLTLEGAVTVHGHSSASARIFVGDTGIRIEGSVKDFDIPGGIIKIKGASLDVSIGPSNSLGRQFTVGIKGSVKVTDLKFTVGVYFKKIPGRDLEYTVYGIFDGELKLSRLAPDIAGSFLDITVKQVAVIASNQDKPSAGVPNTFNYPLKKGLQICATIEKLDAIDSITRSNATSLTLSAGWVPSTGLTGSSFTFDIKLPTDGLITMGPNVKTGPMILGLIVSKNPAISISADLLVTVTKRKEPLCFRLGLEAGLRKAAGSAEMIGMWENPFEMGPDVAFGDLITRLEIDYMKFSASGIPDGFTIGGSMKLGKTEGKMLLQFSQDPTEQLISVDFKNLDCENLIALICKLLDKPISVSGNHDLLFFNKLMLYISTGATIQGKHYERGLKFDADMVVCGKKAKVYAEITDKVVFKGNIDGFTVGNVVVSGATTANPSVDIEISKEVQKVKVDGCVRIGENIVSLDAHIQLAPSPIFFFNTHVTFVGALNFILIAKLKGEIKGMDLRSCDFELYALLEQNLRQYIMEQANAHFEAEGQWDRKQVLEQEFRDAEDVLGRATSRWQTKEALIRKVAQEEEARAAPELGRLRDARDKAKLALDRRTGVLIEQLKAIEMDIESQIRDKKLEARGEMEKIQQQIDYWRAVAEVKQRVVNSMLGDKNRQMEIVKVARGLLETKCNEIDRQVREQEEKIRKASVLDYCSLKWDLAPMISEQLKWHSAFEASKLDYNKARESFEDIVYLQERAALAEALLKADQNELKYRYEEAEMQGFLQRIVREKDAEIERAKEVDIRTIEQLRKEFNEAEAAFKAVDEDTESSLVLARRDLQGILETNEYRSFVLAQTKREQARINLESFNPFKHILMGMANVGTKAFEGLMKDFSGDIVDIKKIEIKGNWKGMVSGKDPLMAYIKAVVAGEEFNMEVKFEIGETLEFFVLLWQEIRKALLEVANLYDHATKLLD